MDRKIINFDPAYFFYSSFQWQIDVRGQSGNTGVTGAGQVAYGNLPRWVAPMDLNAMYPHQVLSWRTILHSLRGRVNILRVKVRDPFRPTFDDIGSTYTGGSIPFSDGAYFSDGSGYEQGMTAPVLASASAGATTINIDGGYLGNALSGGMMFSINDYPYAITFVEGTGADTEITFEPPLRRAAELFDEIDMNATGLMTLEGDLDGALRLEPPAFGRPSLSLVEWIGPYRT